MSDTNLNGPSNGGGAATSSGIVFQQQLGAFFAAQILSNAPLDPSLVLGDATPVRLRFETEAPVDDIIVATSVGGFLTIQAKQPSHFQTMKRALFTGRLNSSSDTG